MTIEQREAELEKMQLGGIITWEEWADLWIEAQLDEEMYPNE